LKAEADFSSRGQNDFICREEKRKAAWGGMQQERETCGPMDQDGNLVFIAFFYCLSVQTDVSWEGEVSPWLIISF
jgi:hypothetical protein